MDGSQQQIPEDVLVYLPITFTGSTHLSGNSPVDQVVFDAYHAALRRYGHYIDSDTLLQSLDNHGLQVISCGPSSWSIGRKTHPYMWSCMVNFLASAIGLELHSSIDIVSWFQQLYQHNYTFIADNVDILARIPRIQQQLASTDFINKSATELLLLQDNSAVARRNIFIEFIAPRKLELKESPLPKLLHGQVLVSLERSLISSGTELKIFTGDFDAEQPVDLTFKGMQDTLAYPLRYGYCAVGKVIELGAGVDATWLGQTVFTFATHGTVAIAEVQSLKIVPSDVLVEDAIFAPSVETAISFLQDGQPLIGEKVAVVGAGLVGQLTAALLSSMGLEVTLIDINNQRLAIAVEFTPSLMTWNPSEQSRSPNESPFDMVIEASGNYRGLQTALDHTGYGGRIVIGSWYGKQEAILKLGLQFHRSHLKLIASQVSSLSAPLTDRWTKERRFDQVWEKMKLLKPSRLLELSGVKATVSQNLVLEDQGVANEDVAAAVEEMYRKLEKGAVLTAMFSYDK